MGFKKRKQNKNLNSIDLSLVKLDLHSHILPGIDDGSKSLEESISIIKWMNDIGYKKIIFTPHIAYEYYNNNYDIIEEKFNLVIDSLPKDIDIAFDFGAEYMLDEFFPKLFTNDKILSFNNKVLGELDLMYKPVDLNKNLDLILNKGFTPILAHPERYRYFNNELQYKFLRNLNVEFQVNILSVIGFYGTHAKNNIEFLIKEGFVDYISTDIHRFNMVEKYNLAFKDPLIHELLSMNTIKNSSLL